MLRLSVKFLEPQDGKSARTYYRSWRYIMTLYQLHVLFKYQILLWLHYMCVCVWNRIGCQLPQPIAGPSNIFFIYAVWYGSLFFRLLLFPNRLTSSAAVHEFCCLQVVIYVSVMSLSACALCSNTLWRYMTHAFDKASLVIKKIISTARK